MMQPENRIKGGFGRVGHVTIVTPRASCEIVNGVVDILDTTETGKPAVRVPMVIGHRLETIV